MKYIHDVPKNQGVANAIRRARTLTDTQWYGRKSIPSCNGVVRAPGAKITPQDTFVTPYATQKGLLYSCALKEEKYLGTTVPLEAFATALLNPYSILYTQSLHMTGGASSCIYGMVCSAFVSYVMGLKYRCNCRDWLALPNVTKIDSFTPEDLQLCDIFNKLEGNLSHITTVTDIVRDETGRVCTIEISECIAPNCARRSFTREQFVKWYMEAENYELLRMKDLSHVTYEPNPYFHPEDEETEAPASFPLMTNYGHNASVRLHEEPVELTLLEGDWEEFVVTRPDGTEKVYPAGEKVKVECRTVGDYKAVCRKGEATSNAVCWHVHRIKLKSDKLVYKVGEPITLTYENAEDDAVFLSRINITPSNSCRAWKELDGGKKGTVTFPGLQAPSNYWAFVMAQGKHCSYISEQIYFEVVE